MPIAHAPLPRADIVAYEQVQSRYAEAKARRSAWEGLWQECYDFAMPQRDSLAGASIIAERQTDQLYDGTACDAVDQLAASLLAQLTPPWSQWFAFAPGPDIPEERRDSISRLLEKASKQARAQIDRSNFAIEMHQAFLDLATVGTACIHVEEAPPGEASALQFTAVPIGQLALQESANGRLEGVFRKGMMPIEEVQNRYPDAPLDEYISPDRAADSDRKLAVVEAVFPDGPAYTYGVFLAEHEGAMLHASRIGECPFICFRWLKSPGEIYGRSPVMKALPDIKTANKVVELILKNASIAVTGIWQADDDGVLNPATIQLTPGTIIPKAVGSQGLKPLDMPGRFDVSQLVLEDLRSRIRHAMLADALTPINGRKMTATEVIERSAEMARVLGATYGRLQSELLTPLIRQVVRILKRRGEIPDLNIDDRLIALEYRSPLARSQAQRDVEQTLGWLRGVASLGPEALQSVDIPAAVKWLGQTLAVPPELIRSEIPLPPSVPLSASEPAPTSPSSSTTPETE